MADLSITAANVATITGGSTTSGTAGATITAGQLVYKDATDSDKIKLADANSSISTADSVGVALHASLAGQPITYQVSGDYTTGGTMTVGAIYIVSATAGGIAPVADLTTGWYPKVWMVAKTTTVATIINRGPSTLVAVP